MHTVHSAPYKAEIMPVSAVKNHFAQFIKKRTNALGRADKKFFC